MLFQCTVFEIPNKRQSNQFTFNFNFADTSIQKWVKLLFQESRKLCFYFKRNPLFKKHCIFILMFHPHVIKERNVRKLGSYKVTRGLTHAQLIRLIIKVSSKKKKNRILL